MTSYPEEYAFELNNNHERLKSAMKLIVTAEKMEYNFQRNESVPKPKYRNLK